MTDRSAPKNIDEYIAAFKMQAFTLDGDLIYFAADP
jgi:hypothetical protein